MSFNRVRRGRHCQSPARCHTEMQQRLSGVSGHSDKHALGHYPKAQCAFKSSPTETLLRLHLPLDDKVWRSSRSQIPIKEPGHNLDSSPDHPIGRCDGRCVQRAGT
eukprot:scaffold14650_cov2710-Alexandrium_tamarense.AAC.1